MPRFSKAELNVLDTEIQNLQKKGVVQLAQFHPDQYISTMFVVPKKDGGNRPIINLKRLNQNIPYRHFKMEGIHMLKDLLQKGDYMCKLDLQDAYFCIPVAPKDRKYLRFRWKNKILEFVATAFGLAPAPRRFTKLLKPVVGLLRRLGLRLIIYLDDMLIIANSKEKLIQDRDTTLFLLQNLGFVINWNKSVLDPTQCIEFLGFQVNSQDMMFYLPQHKVLHIRKTCHEMLLKHTVHIRDLAMIVGKMVSTMQAILPATLQC